MNTIRSFLFAFCILTAATPHVFATEIVPWYGVVVEEATARCGPGVDYYETSRLFKGDRLEIYDETADGWCAVRPPIGSFSWINAQYVSLAPNGIGTITVDGLASRIGSESGDQCHAVSAYLKKGEKVHILDRRETPENTASPIWYKIAPPNGEFRWVERKSIVPIPHDPSGLEVSESRVDQGSVDQSSADQSSADQSSAAVGSRGAKRLGSLNSNREAYAEYAIRQTALRSNENDRLAPSGNADSSPEQAFRKALADLREEVSDVLTQPTEDWVFDTLLHHAGNLYEEAPSETDREKILHLSETLRRTQSIRREISTTRHNKGLVVPKANAIQTVSFPVSPHSQGSPKRTPRISTFNTTPTPLNTPAPLPAVSRENEPTSPVPLTSPHAAKTAAQPLAQPPVDGPQPSPAGNPVTPAFGLVGRLGRFNPLPPGHPPYAIVDEKGEVICLLTPAPGVGMADLVGQWIGVNGKRDTYRQDGEADQRHILVENVAPLAD